MHNVTRGMKQNASVITKSMHRGYGWKLREREKENKLQEQDNFTKLYLTTKVQTTDAHSWHQQKK